MGRLGVLAAALLTAPATVCADVAGTFPTSASNLHLQSHMQLSITSDADMNMLPVSYTIIPLIADLGLNESQTDRGKISLPGKLILADASTYANISGSDAIPYLCCDDTDDSYITTNAILNVLMDNDPQPQAILLYSLQDQACRLTGKNLNFQRLLSMANKDSASELADITASAPRTATATISGNLTNSNHGQHGQQTAANSAVAMSILYSITGLITFLFLATIAIGAMRAHRYPERYGPRSGVGGQPRQSRAKGLARAVLDTLPIVQFGDTQPAKPAKPDPDVELEESEPPEPPSAADAHRESPRHSSERHLPTIPVRPSTPVNDVEATGALSASNDTPIQSDGEATSGANSPSPGIQDNQVLECSICTDDFLAGEDVRVLPCNHKFHPACVDPWLVNVSGTCPLCRLDLRPEHEVANQETPEAEEPPEAPPLGAEAGETGDSASTPRRRSRLFDLARLRHAPVEERLEALRRIRSEQPAGAAAAASAEDQGRARARLAVRLRDRFRVRTRAARRASAQLRSRSPSPVDTSPSRPS